MYFKRDGLDDLINQLNGVLSAHAVFDGDDQLVEIHVLSNQDRAPKQLVRDIQSAIQAAYGVSVDYKIISVAQIDERGCNLSRRDVRAILQKISLNLSRNTIEAQVVLQVDDQEYSGVWQGLVSGAAPDRAAALACTGALQELCGNRVRFILTSLDRHQVQNTSCVVVSVTMTDSCRDISLFGISPIRAQDTDASAAVKAVLNAVNRQIGFVVTAGKERVGH